MKIGPRSKLLFIGDSITDCERARPVGEGLFGAVGKIEALPDTLAPGTRVVVLDIPDNYVFMDPALVSLLQRKVAPLLKVRFEA